MSAVMPVTLPVMVMPVSMPTRMLSHGVRISAVHDLHLPRHCRRVMGKLPRRLLRIHIHVGHSQHSNFVTDRKRYYPQVAGSQENSDREEMRSKGGNSVRSMSQIGEWRGVIRAEAGTRPQPACLQGTTQGGVCQQMGSDMAQRSSGASMAATPSGWNCMNRSNHILRNIGHQAVTGPHCRGILLDNYCSSALVSDDVTMCTFLQSES